MSTSTPTPSSAAPSQSQVKPGMPRPPLQNQRFQTDVRRTRGLQAGQILLQRRPNASSTYDALQDETTAAAARAANLKEEEQRLNKRIDEHVRSMESGLAELIQMFRVGDKAPARAEQEGFTSEFRADQIVRATSGLADLGRALQLSLLLSQSKDGAIEEARSAKQLKAEIEEMRQEGGRLLGSLLGVDDGVAGPAEKTSPAAGLDNSHQPSDPLPVDVEDVQGIQHTEDSHLQEPDVAAATEAVAEAMAANRESQAGAAQPSVLPVDSATPSGGVAIETTTAASGLEDGSVPAAAPTAPLDNLPETQQPALQAPSEATAQPAETEQGPEAATATATADSGDPDDDADMEEVA
ncbi:unnamed protein product [Parajaminaea phylloscopi]